MRRQERGRDRADYDAAIAGLEGRYPHLTTQGFESRLFDLGERVLKVPKWVFLAALPLERERRERAEDVRRLAVYAPLARAKAVAIDREGRVDANRPLVCWGILMRKGTPWLGNRERAATSLASAAVLGASLAARHIAATGLGDQSADWTPSSAPVRTVLETACAVLRAAYPSALRPLDESELTLGALAKAAGTLDLRTNLGHGDPGVQNAVMIDGRLQWVDVGRGPLRLIAPELRFDEEGAWDLAILRWSIDVQFGTRAADRAVAAYARGRGIASAAMHPGLGAWEIVWLLTLAAVSARHWRDFAGPDGDGSGDGPEALLHPIIKQMSRRLASLEG